MLGDEKEPLVHIAERSAGVAGCSRRGEVSPTRGGIRSQIEVNPFVSKITSFPGRLFSFRDFAFDCAAIAELLTRFPRAMCEIGSGSGGHLIEQARRAPDTAYLGFELRYKRAVRTIEKAFRADVENVFVLHVDARQMQSVIPPESLDALYVLFPDPWPKRKQRKHRILTREFLAAAARLLRRSGTLEIKSDTLEYFSYFLNLLVDSAHFDVECSTSDLYRSVYLEGNVPTEFERLFVSQELPICWLRARKR